MAEPKDGKLRCWKWWCQTKGGLDESVQERAEEYLRRLENWEHELSGPHLIGHTSVEPDRYAASHRPRRRAE